MKNLKLLAILFLGTTLQFCSSDSLNSNVESPTKVEQKNNLTGRYSSDNELNIDDSSGGSNSQNSQQNQRVSLKGYYNSNTNKHFYSSNGLFVPQPAVLDRNLGYLIQIPNSSTYLGGIILWYNYDNKDSFLCANPQENLQIANSTRYQKIATYNSDGNIPVYRYYRSSTNSHFYTTNFNELGNGRFGFSYEGEAFKISSFPY